MKKNHTILAFMILLPSILFSACEAVEEPLPATRDGWRQLLKWDDHCETEWITEFFNDSSSIGVDYDELSASDSLVTVICRIASYNQGAIVFHMHKGKSGRQIKLLEFPQFNFIEPKPDSSGYFDPNIPVPADTVDLFYTYTDRLLWGNQSVDKEKQTITNDNFYRGGDTGCGLHTVYKLVDGKPQVVEFRARPHCRVGSVPISEWKLYPQEARDKWPPGPVPEL